MRQSKDKPPKTRESLEEEEEEKGFCLFDEHQMTNGIREYDKKSRASKKEEGTLSDNYPFIIYLRSNRRKAMVYFRQ